MAKKHVLRVVEGAVYPLVSVIAQDGVLRLEQNKVVIKMDPSHARNVVEAIMKSLDITHVSPPTKA
jgi:phosphoribosylaminoimidazole carboxylase (NCAIR synthetase)